MENIYPGWKKAVDFQPFIIFLFYMRYFFLLAVVFILCCAQAPAVKKARSGKCILGDCLKVYGVMVYPDGGRYAGRWENGARHYFGEMIYPDGSRYVGEWKDDMRHGSRGSMTWPGGESYFGRWRDDMRSTRMGEYIYRNGDVYIGGWKNDRMDGLGFIMDRNNKIVKKGFWNDGKYSGE